MLTSSVASCRRLPPSISTSMVSNRTSPEVELVALVELLAAASEVELVSVELFAA